MNSCRTGFGGRITLRLACVLLMGFGSTSVMADHWQQANPDLQEYAATCDSEIGATVIGFDCTTGTALPMDGREGEECWKPPYLPFSGCFAGSRIGQQPTINPDVDVVFMCRKKHAGYRPEQFDDIAVIQTNVKTGKTCFYQKLEDKIDGSAVKAPSTGKFWMEPRTMARPGNACAQCHDNGAFLRTPYVMQAKDQIPAFGPTRRNKDHYSFPGDKFLHWNGRVSRLAVTGYGCVGCHTMGANTINPSYGTSAWLGRYATGQQPSPYYVDPVRMNGLAHWMTPDKAAPSPVDMEKSRQFFLCATTEAHLPKCVRRSWGGQIEALIEEMAKTGEKYDE